MNHLKKIFFTNKHLVEKLKSKDSLALYYINFFLIITLIGFSSLPNSAKLPIESVSNSYFDFLFTICLTHPLLMLLNRKVFKLNFFVGSALSITINTTRFLLLYILLMGIEFIFHGALIYYSALSMRTLTSVDPYIEFVCWAYLYYMLIDFIVQYYNSQDIVEERKTYDPMSTEKNEKRLIVKLLILFAPLLIPLALLFIQHCQGLNHLEKEKLRRQQVIDAASE